MLYKENFKYRAISDRTGLALSTVHKIIIKYTNKNTIEHLSGNGRPSKLSNSTKHHLLNLNNENGFLSTRKIAKKIQIACNTDISHAAVKNYLNKMDIEAFIPYSKPF